MNPATWGAAPIDACTATQAGAAGPDRIARNSYDAADQLLKVEKAVTTRSARTTPPTNMISTAARPR